MYCVSIKDVGSEYAYQQVKRFRTYRNAYYYIAEILWRQNPNYHWSYSLKYLQDGYDKKKIFPFGNNFIRKNKKCYKIKLEGNAIQNRKIKNRLSIHREENKINAMPKRNGCVLAQ